MRIAFVSLEYPPDTAIGGIATYMYQVSFMLKSRGHDVEVFSYSPEKEKHGDEGSGIIVHRITDCDKFKFKEKIVLAFSKIHLQKPFDLIESAEYMADALEIKRVFPNLPLVVKLHTPDFWVKEISGLNPLIPGLFARCRFNVGAYRRGKVPRPYWWQYDKNKDPDFLITNLADLITTPSISLGKIVHKRWQIPTSRIVHLPNPFSPIDDLLQIPVESKGEVVSFFGRLEIRKGVTIFKDVIPTVLEAFPNAQFKFIGRDQASHIDGITMKEFLIAHLGNHSNNIHFIDHVPFDHIAEQYANTDICVFPSIWENFPNVCLEAMSAGRAIIGSRKGGMHDMLARPKAGILVNPLSSKAIANAIVILLSNKPLRIKLGLQARESALRKYNSNRIGKTIEIHYSKLIQKKNPQ